MLFLSAFYLTFISDERLGSNNPELLRSQVTRSNFALVSCPMIFGMMGIDPPTFQLDDLLYHQSYSYPLYKYKLNSVEFNDLKQCMRSSRHWLAPAACVGTSVTHTGSHSLAMHLFEVHHWLPADISDSSCLGNPLMYSLPGHRFITGIWHSYW